MKQFSLREARKKRGLTQEQLADASGIEQAVISKIERGGVKNPRFDTVVKLAHGLRMDPRALRFGQSEAVSA